jgi:hypothetical protein
LSRAGRRHLPSTLAGPAHQRSNRWDKVRRGSWLTPEPRGPGRAQPYDPGWRATIDGRPVEVLPTDYLLQGVLVPAGHHVVHLQYEDASVRNGLAGSGLSIGILLGAAFVLGRREKLWAQGTDEPSLEDAPKETTIVGAGHPARRRG